MPALSVISNVHRVNPCWLVVTPARRHNSALASHIKPPSTCTFFPLSTPMTSSQPGHVPPRAAVPSHNFQLLFNNALKAYEKRTNNDLLAHPLAAQLQTCNSPATILAVLHQQIRHLNQSRTADEKWTRWLDPTVNVLYALSGTLGEGVGLVCMNTWTYRRCALSRIFDRSSYQPK